jgi:deazaflavin-dependent oxidoreductase (nitroreductase family)
MAELSSWNSQRIEEFRTNKGKIGGPFKDAPMLLLTTTGAKSGKRHTIPLVYLPDNDRLIIFASNAGSPTEPDWYHNIIAHPQVTIEFGTETFDATATILTGEERDRLYNKQAKVNPVFADFQAKTDRVIPVIALQREVG